MKSLLQLLNICVLCSSCYTAQSLHKAVQKQDREIVSTDIKGIYELTDSRYDANLYNLLKSNTSFDYKKRMVDNAKAKIALIDSTAIYISLVKDGLEIESFELKGEITAYGFLTHRLKKIYPFWPIFYIHWENRILLGLDNQNHLLLSYGSQSGGMILFYGAGSGFKKVHVFSQLDND